jgi:hypothetical protein
VAVALLVVLLNGSQLHEALILGGESGFQILLGLGACVLVGYNNYFQIFPGVSRVFMLTLSKNAKQIRMEIGDY